MKITRQKIQAALRKAGHNKHESHSTRIRGWHNHTSGYDVYEDEDSVYVDWFNGNHWAKPDQVARSREVSLSGYETSLAAFAPARGENKWGEPCIKISKSPL